MEEIDTVCAADMLPVRAHEADAGADLKAARDVAIRPGDKIYFCGDPEGFALKCIAVGWPPCPVEFVDLEETGTTAWETSLRI